LSGRFAAQEYSIAAAVKTTRMDRTTAELRVRATKRRDSTLSRRLLAIAMVLEGGAREDASRQAGMDRQTLLNGVHSTQVARGAARL